MNGVAFKPYACGTMAQPFIDCAVALAESGVDAADVREIVCEVAEGTVHRLWEPLASKQRPPTAYAAKFSTPFCMAVAFVDRRAGFAQFTDTRIQDPAVLSLAAKIRYVVNPDDEYPRAFAGHLRATMTDGTTCVFRQPHLRGGRHAPLTAVEVEAKFRDNARYGGWPVHTAERFLAFSHEAFTAGSLEALQDFRS
jgi:2-methylcitrate dehydratase PrpD